MSKTLRFSDRQTGTVLSITKRKANESTDIQSEDTENAAKSLQLTLRQALRPPTGELSLPLIFFVGDEQASAFPKASTPVFFSLDEPASPFLVS